MSVYDGAAGPYEVDWYWHPLSSTAVPTDARVLFNKGVRETDTAPEWGYLPEDQWPEPLRRVYTARTPDDARAEEVRNLVSLFWAMWMIAAKGIARSPEEPPLRHVEFLRELTARVRTQLGRPSAGSGDVETAYPSAAAKLAVLRTLGREMEALMPEAAALAPDVPTAAVPRAKALVDLIEGTLRDDGRL